MTSPRMRAATHARLDHRVTARPSRKTRSVKAWPQEDPVPGNEHRGFRQSRVGLDEIRKREAVAVEEDQIIAGRLKSGQIAGARRAKSLMFLPDELEGIIQPAMEILRHRRGAARRPVIGDDDLEVGPALLVEGEQNGLQGVGAVVGGYDDRGDHAPSFAGSHESCKVGAGRTFIFP